MSEEDVDARENPGRVLVEVDHLSVNSQKLIEELWGGGEGQKIS